MLWYKYSWSNTFTASHNFNRWYFHYNLVQKIFRISFEFFSLWSIYYQVCYLILTCLRNFSNNLSLLKKNSWVNCIWSWEWVYIHKRILTFKFVEICFVAQSVVKLNECSIWTWNEFMWLWLLDKIVNDINYSHWIDGGVESNDIFADGLSADSVSCRSTHFCFMCFDVQLVGTYTLKTDIFLENWPFTYYETPLCLPDICYPW